LFGARELAVAQDIFGRIVGTVIDSSGSAVPDARVSVINEARRFSRVVTSEKNGYFVADELPAGTYTVWQGRWLRKTSKIGNFYPLAGRLTVALIWKSAHHRDVTVTATGDTVNTTSGEILDEPSRSSKYRIWP